MLTDFDVAELAGIIPDDYFDVKPPPIISPDKLRALYTAQSFHEAEIDAREGVIAWCATNHYYRHFETHQKLIDFIQGSPPATRSWSERIYAAQPQKLRIDFDSKDRFEFDLLKTHIRDLFQRTYDQFLMPHELITCDMSDATKQSAHFIVNGYYVASNAEAKHFAVKLREEITAEHGAAVAAAIDLQIYSRATGLRAVFNSKFIDGLAARTKVPPEGVDPVQTLITYIEGCRQLPRVANTVETVNTIPREVVDEAAGRIPVKYTEGFQFRSINGSYINFTRTHASACIISGEVHHHDNTMFGIVVDAGVKLRCRHCPGSVFVPLDNVAAPARKVVKDPEWKKKQIKSFCERPAAETELNAPIVYRYKGEMNAHRDLMESLAAGCSETPQTIFVRARMGVGKTSALRRFINETSPKSILAVSFRISFTAGMCGKFNLTSYRMIDGMMSVEDYPRLMVQCESLHRVDPRPYELLVLDEVQSVIQQMFSFGTHKHALRSWAVLEHMIARAKTVVCMDANIDQATIDLVSRIRGGKTLLHLNDAIPKMSRHKIVEKKTAGVALVMKLLGEGKHVVVPSTSCDLAEKIYAYAEKMFPQGSHRIYTSKTPEDVKTRDFADVNTSWAGHNLLIFTPTVLAGLSYTRSDYDVAVCFWFDSSVDIFGSLQMMGRFRDIASGTYYHYISERSSDLPDTCDSLLAHITESYKNFVHADAPECDLSGFLEDGRVAIHDTARFRAWLGVQARLNYSRNHFLEAFIRELKLSGGEVSLYEDITDAAHGKIVNAQLRQIGEDITTAEAALIAAAPDITADEYARFDAGGSAAIRYRFRRFYKYEGEITPELLVKYGKLRLKCQYLRRSRLRTFEGGPEDGLRGLMGSVAAASSLLGVDVEHIKSVFDVSRDKIAHDLMRVFGPAFDCTYVLTREELVAKLHARHDSLVRDCKHTCKVFGVKSVALPARDDPDYVKKMLDFINGKLDAQYGLKIKATDTNRVRYTWIDSFSQLFDENLNIKI